MVHSKTSGKPDPNNVEATDFNKEIAKTRKADLKAMEVFEWLPLNIRRPGCIARAEYLFGKKGYLPSEELPPSVIAAAEELKSMLSTFNFPAESESLKHSLTFLTNYLNEKFQLNRGVASVAR